MTRRRLPYGDRKRRQRGSILSSILIIVAFMSILVGALMTELTDSFLVSRTLVNRVQREATVTSAVELGIHQLQSGTTPAVCARDARGPWFVTLNGNPAAVTESCQAIVPDVATSLAPGAFTVDGVHDTTAGRDQYIVSDSSGQLRAYAFGQTSPRWTLSVPGRPTAASLPALDGDGAPMLLVPTAANGSGCGGHCVASFTAGGGTPRFHCAMPASTTVSTPPAAEVSAGRSSNFPDYTFFAGSGAAGRLYVFDDSSTGNCAGLQSAQLGGGATGAPLVFPVRSSGRQSADEIFVLVSDGRNTDLQHWRYTETDGQDGQDGANTDLSLVSTLRLTNQVGGSSAGYAINSVVPNPGTNLTLVVAGTTGRLASVRIAVGQGQSYTASVVATGTIPGAVTRSPYWCHCPAPAQNLIGVGTTNGLLYVLNPALAVQWSYDGQPDGRPPIVTTPAADANGDWYFGAADGYVYDVEIPASGSQMFKAARFGPGGSILSSPIVGGAADGCGAGPCLYFGSSTSGSYFARIGTTRVIDLRACVTSAVGSISCAEDPRLWARVEVGSPAVLGNRGVYVQGWSYYSP